MIGYLRGRLVIKTEETAIIDVNGVGYEAYCSASALLGKERGETVELFTHMAVKEDGVSLFGFSSLRERELFLKLTSVSGVGPKTGIAVFSAMSVEDFSVAIATADVKRLSTVKGLGKKTAEKVILELHGKISAEELLGQSGDMDRPVLTQKLSKEEEDIVNALMGFGYKRQESVQALKRAKESGAVTVEEILRKALQMGI